MKVEAQGMKNLQQAADDVAVIADAIEELGALLDNFHANHGEELYSRLERVWPTAAQFGGAAAEPLYKLKRDLDYPED